MLNYGRYNWYQFTQSSYIAGCEKQITLEVPCILFRSREYLMENGRPQPPLQSYV
jgi:hypothetical protein